MARLLKRRQIEHWWIVAQGLREQSPTLALGIEDLCNHADGVRDLVKALKDEAFHKADWQAERYLERLYLDLISGSSSQEEHD